MGSGGYLGDRFRADVFVKVSFDFVELEAGVGATLTVLVAKPDFAFSVGAGDDKFAVVFGEESDETGVNLVFPIVGV